MKGGDQVLKSGVRHAYDLDERGGENHTQMQMEGHMMMKIVCISREAVQ